MQGSKSTPPIDYSSDKKSVLFPKERRVFLIVAPLILVGFALTFEGIDLMDGSGLLFGQYECMGPVCGLPYETVRTIFWGGLSLFLVGVTILIVGSIFLFRLRRKISKGVGAKILSRNERRVFASSFIVALILIAFFLLPIVPFQKTYGVQPANTFPRIDACYQNSPVVNSAVYEYQGFASLSYFLFNQGNFVYSNCLVVSGT